MLSVQSNNIESKMQRGHANRQVFKRQHISLRSLLPFDSS